jgi:hypothetical protein
MEQLRPDPLVLSFYILKDSTRGPLPLFFDGYKPHAAFKCNL